MLSSDFEYNLPDAKIARHPVSPRRSARLLRVSSDGLIEHGTFESLPKYLSKLNCDGLWANETKVIQARLFMKKPTGGRLEIFLLEPVDGIAELALSATQKSNWRCLVRGGRKWTASTAELVLNELTLKVSPISPEKGLVMEDGGTFNLSFTWSGAPSFGDVLDKLGRMPLPPYMHRESDENDAIEYQTVFARLPGSVAAPTAGLHFDDVLLSELREVGCALETLTLHVGAGTFRPLTEGVITEHVMHAERCVITKQILEKLSSQSRRVATGTTTLRTLESLYWMAVIHKKTGVFPEILGQWTPYEDSEEHNWPYNSAIEYLLEYAPLDTTWSFQTQIMIKPGYKLKSVIALITNFHQPSSTLLCLVAACMAKNWKEVYKTALEDNYRFLSYGDGCLIEL